MAARLHASQIAATNPEDLSQLVTNVCAGHTVEAVLRACADAMVGVLVFASERPEDADGFIAEIPNDLRRNVRAHWQHYKDQIAAQAGDARQ